MAILAGDGLQAEAFHLLAREPRCPPTLMARKLRVLSLVADAAGAGRHGRWTGDRSWRGRPGPGSRHAGAVSADAGCDADMHARKTGALIRASAAAAPSWPAQTDRSRRSIATAPRSDSPFRSSTTSSTSRSAATLGKTAGKDAAAGKPTYPALFGLERSRELAAECLPRARKRSSEPALVDSGSRYRVDHRAHDLGSRAAR